MTDTRLIAGLEEPIGIGLLNEKDRPAWNDLDRKPFLFRHSLAESALFELPRLAKLSELAAARANRGRFFARGSRTAGRTTAEDILELSRRNDWIKISYANVLDPEFGALHERLLNEIERFAPVPVRKTMNWTGMTIFLNSPGLAVPYHFDHETNFLMQVRGVKDVFLYDQTDRSILTEPEIENFYLGDAMAGRYRDELEHRGKHFVLRPGDAVHHPPLAPHRLTNRDEVSVSVSIFFTQPEPDRRAHIYQVNAFARRIGLRPKAPGASPRADRVKIALVRAISIRKPKSQGEMLFSGVRRVLLPVRIVKKIGSLAKR